MKFMPENIAQKAPNSEKELSCPTYSDILIETYPTKIELQHARLRTIDKLNST